VDEDIEITINTVLKKQHNTFDTSRALVVCSETITLPGCCERNCDTNNKDCVQFFHEAPPSSQHPGGHGTHPIGSPDKPKRTIGARISGSGSCNSQKITKIEITPMTSNVAVVSSKEDADGTDTLKMVIEQFCNVGGTHTIRYYVCATVINDSEDESVCCGTVEFKYTCNIWINEPITSITPTPDLGGLVDITVGFLQPLQSPLSISVMNSHGGFLQQIYTGIPQGLEYHTSVSLGHLPTGIYMIVFSVEDESLQIPYIKQ
jgi:hypothetical protein